ncbi:MAG TPA: MAB_1171c family putative transporter [Streptosporangiaceae bacterium]
MTGGVLAVTVLWVVVLAQFPSQRQVPVRWAVWATLVLLAAIGTLNLAAVGAWLDAASGLPNAADVAQHVLAVVASTLARYCVVQVFGPPRPRSRWPALIPAALAAAVVAALLTTFALSPALTHPTDTARYTDFPMQYAADPQVIAYWLIFVAYLGTTFGVIARLTWRYGRRAGRSPLGGGLLLVAAGMVAGLGYLAYGTAEVAARAAGARGPFISTAPRFIQGLFGALVVLVAVGGVLPATRHWTLVRQAARYRSLRQLYPLWAALCQAVPGIALDPAPAWADRLDPRDLQVRLYRRVIEIRDGYLALTPVEVPGIEDLVAAAGPDELRAADRATLAAAIQLELARRAELRGDPRPRPAAGAAPPTASREFLAGHDLDSEVRLLSTVAAHWATVTLTAERLERGQLAASR